MYNLLEYSKNYRKTIGSFYNYYRDELNNNQNNNDIANFNNRTVVNSEAFKYKNKIIGNTYNVDSTIPNPAGGESIDNLNYVQNNSGKKSVELAIPLKSLGNFWIALNIPLISCEVSLELKWNENCVITSLQQAVVLDGDDTAEPTGATLNITNCKLYISQMSTEANNNNLNILIDPTFTNVNQLFVLAYQVDANNNDNRQSFSRFYLPNVMVKDYNVIIDKLAFLDLSIKNEEEAYEKIIDSSKISKYTAGNLLDYDYCKKHYKLVAIDLSKQQLSQENKDLIQQINFIGRLEAAANIFIIIERKKRPF